MKRLPPSGYVTAADSARPGYLRKRMAAYRMKLALEKEARERAEAETKRKVAKIGKAA